MDVHPEPEELGLSSPRLKRIKTWMQEYINDGKLPGATTLLARHGKVAFCETIGYGDRSLFNRCMDIRCFSASRKN